MVLQAEELGDHQSRTDALTEKEEYLPQNWQEFI